MATATPPSTPRNLDQDRMRIRSPLGRLRKYIHSYVGLEGAAIVGLFLALYFWVGLGVDYGFFKLFLFDWVQSVPWGFRLGVLIVIVLGLAALFLSTVLFRLLR